MAVYPTPGGSGGTWGAETSAFHAVTRDLDTGKVKNEALQVASTAPIADAALANKKYVDDNTTITTLLTRAAGKVNSAGTKQYGTNFTSVRNAAGTYTLTFTTAFADTSYVVNADCVGAATSRFCMYTITNASTAVIYTRSAVSGNLADQDFSFTAVGDQ